MAKIIVIGSTNTDMVVRSARIPVPGETVTGGTFLLNPGGKGANQAVACARLGGETAAGRYAELAVLKDEPRKIPAALDEIARHDADDRRILSERFFCFAYMVFMPQMKGVVFRDDTDDVHRPLQKMLAFYKAL